MSLDYLDGAGYFAASCVLATFCMRSMIGLRTMAIVSNVAFLAYGFPMRLWPIVWLHGLLLPLNLMRLHQCQIYTRRSENATNAYACSRP